MVFEVHLLLYWLSLKACLALGRKGPLLFSLMKKVTKKSSQQRCFFALMAFALQYR